MASGSVITSSNRIDERFEDLRSRGRKALVCYVTAGHPDRGRSLELLQGLESAGADVLEVGVPFSDPLADGPVIQASSQRALDAGMTLDGVLDLVRDAELTVPVVLFGYLNPFLAAGEKFLERIHEAGCDGVLVTDLPVGADPPLESRIASSPVAFIRLVAPTTPLDRMKLIARNGSGFVYLISRLGVTGMRNEVAPELGATVARLRSATSLPICVGFGVTDARQAAAVTAIADGVVVGSAIVKAADESVSAAVSLVESMRVGIDAASRHG
jgi:tryptophan synthase alpha chain